MFRLGILVPSSNTALEPITNALLADLNASFPPQFQITAHFSRFQVTSISLSATSIAQFDFAAIVPAAKLLADAKVDIIGWSGTSGGWLGFDKDKQLCDVIQTETGIRCTSSVAALNKALSVLQVKRLGLITPYTTEVQAGIMLNYRQAGITIPSDRERHLDLVDNIAIGEVREETLDAMVDEITGERDLELDAVITFCTNLSAARRVRHWENVYGRPFIDTVSVVIWDMLQELKINTYPLWVRWGELFQFKNR
jgi:maleate isomerase